MPHQTNNLCYEFGQYHLDFSKRVLMRGRETISLAPKATEILMMLVMNAGELVEKDALLKQVWPDTFVEEANLTQNIFTLRRVLGDERAGPKYIETVPRRGYRFVATVRAVNEERGGNLESSAAGPLTVIAILPFVNGTGKAELEYLADGLTESLINNLSGVSRLRVMSRSRVLRYKVNSDPLEVANELGASAVLIGSVSMRNTRIVIGVELVDTSNGWQLWGESFDSGRKDILQIQEAITRGLLSTLKLTLSGEDVKRATARYTENAQAYQCYLEGRYYWSQYTKKGMEKAIVHFGEAIAMDPNYALAYAGIVDCYLRLATNYLPPEDDLPTDLSEISPFDSNRPEELDPKIKLRFEWDWKSAERELRRANDLQIAYPSAHQWYAAYRLSKELFQQSLQENAATDAVPTTLHITPQQLYAVALSANEETQIFCTIARDQIEVGNYEAGCLMLCKWWTPGEWPHTNGLNLTSTADLLFTSGSLAGCLSSTGNLHNGQKHTEALLSGAISIFEHLAAKRSSAESQIELALSYYRQGRFDLSRKTLLRILQGLRPTDRDLRSLALIRLGVAERHAGQVTDSLSRLIEAYGSLQENAPLITGRYYQELGTALRDLAVAEKSPKYFQHVTKYFQRAYYEFVAIGHHRYAAVVENNLGFLLLNLECYPEAEVHLLRAQRLFKTLRDKTRSAQVDDTLARVYMATGRLRRAELTAQRAVSSLEQNDEEALLAEALTTKGMILCKLQRYSEARAILEGARCIADRCGDLEGSGRALLVMVEQLQNELTERELSSLSTRMAELLQHAQLASTRSRLNNCLKQILAQEAKSERKIKSPKSRQEI
jgi:DNA-binding winged helix-turn-helix (wHTH) protein/tetratricopeptide (TPR) repeat protein